MEMSQPQTPGTQAQIAAYIASQPGPKRADMQVLHDLIQTMMPACRLWFLDGTSPEGKTVSNPNIGYGVRAMIYADGATKDFYQIGLSANTTGLSVYILGLADKTHLSRTYGAQLGKASVTGYCIRFKSLQHINLDILQSALRDGIAAQSQP